MIIGAIIIGVLIFALIGVGSRLSDKCGSGFDVGAITGVIITTLMIIEVCLIANIRKPTPSALDVYRGNTELEITYVNGISTDTVVVFKKETK